MRVRVRSSETVLERRFSFFLLFFGAFSIYYHSYTPPWAKPGIFEPWMQVTPQLILHFNIAIVLLRDNLYTLSLTYAYVCLYFLDVQNNNKSDACNRTISTTTHLSASSNILTKSGPIELKLCTRPIVYILMTMGVFFWCKVIRNLKICKWPLSHKSHA